MILWYHGFEDKRSIQTSSAAIIQVETLNGDTTKRSNRSMLAVYIL